MFSQRGWENILRETCSEDPVLAGDPPPEGMAFQEPRRVWERQGPLWPCGRAAWDVGDDTGNLQPLLPVSPQWEREAEK